MEPSAPAEAPKLPVEWKEQLHRDLHYHQKEWSSGTRGGGMIPKDFDWLTNPKQRQEENGSGEALRPLSR